MNVGETVKLVGRAARVTGGHERSWRGCRCSTGRRWSDIQVMDVADSEDSAQFGPPVVLRASNAPSLMKGATLHFDGGYTVQ
jgi:hypothetical protein